MKKILLTLGGGLVVGAATLGSTLAIINKTNIDKHESKFSRFNSLLSNLSTTFDSVEKKQDVQDGNIKNLYGHIADAMDGFDDGIANSENRIVQAFKKELALEVNKIKADFISLHNGQEVKLSGIAEKLNAMMTEYEDTKKQVDIINIAMAEVLGSYKEDKDALWTAVDSLKTEIDNNKTTILQNTDEIDILKLKLDGVTTSILKIDILKSELNAIKTILDKYIANVENLDSKVNTVNIKLDNLKQISNTYKVKIDLLESNIKFLKDKSITIDNKITEIETNANANATDIQDLTAMIASLKTIQGTNTGTIEEIKKNLKLISDEMILLQNQNQDFFYEITKLHAYIVGMNKTIYNLVQEVNKLQNKESIKSFTVNVNKNWKDPIAIINTNQIQQLSVWARMTESKNDIYNVKLIDVFLNGQRTFQSTTTLLSKKSYLVNAITLENEIKITGIWYRSNNKNWKRIPNKFEVIIDKYVAIR